MSGDSEVKTKAWVHIDLCEPIKRSLFEQCLGHKKIIEPMTLDVLLSIYDDGFYGNIECVHQDNKNLFQKIILTSEDRVILRKILKTSGNLGNLGRLREIDSQHTEDSARHIDQNTKHLAKLAFIQIVIGSFQLLVALTSIALAFIHH